MTRLQLDDLGRADRLLTTLTCRYPGVLVLEHEGDSFLIDDPDRTLSPEQQRPFCTLVTGDHGETVSRLDRDPDTYRVSLALGRSAYEARFGPAPRERDATGVLDTGFDYAAVDQLLPHPHYASQYWACVINPGPQTVADLGELLDAAQTHARRVSENRIRRSG